MRGVNLQSSIFNLQSTHLRYEPKVSAARKIYYERYRDAKCHQDLRQIHCRRRPIVYCPPGEYLRIHWSKRLRQNHNLAHDYGHFLSGQWLNSGLRRRGLWRPLRPHRIHAGRARAIQEDEGAGYTSVLRGAKEREERHKGSRFVAGETRPK